MTGEAGRRGNVAPAGRPPLDGIRVVDVTRALAGPFCTMLLGDHGAEVIKIEQPGIGDDSRNSSNPRLGSQNSAFLAVNRNKKSVEVDIKTPRGRALVQRLVAQSDVFVENMRPGKADALGLGWDELHALNPRLVYCSISGWGADGPYAGRAGYALTAEALGGLMSVTGPRDGDPVKVGVSIIDNLTGLYAKDAITSALLARERTGEGQKVETSLLESTVSILSMSAAAFLMAGHVATRWGSEHEWHVPWKSFQTADGYLVLASSSEGQWVKICAAIGQPELAGDARFASMPMRDLNRDELYKLLDEVFLSRGTTEWLELLSDAGAAAAPINRIDQVFSDPQVLHRDMLVSVNHPTLGDIPQVGHAQKLSATPASIRLHPPMLGEQTADVLRELAGCSVADLAELSAAGVIGAVGPSARHE